MRIVDDSSGTDNADPVVQSLRQFWFVIEVRKDVGHVESQLLVQRQTLAATVGRENNFVVRCAPCVKSESFTL